MSVVISSILILIYITFRFDFMSGASAVVCLLHDIFIMLAFYSLFHIPMNTAVIAAFLTILGYSLNSNIIVFDRVRENVKFFPKLSFAENVDNSINQTLTRSINTTVSTVMTITVVYILGVSSIRDFVLPLIIGIMGGLYSSICMAGPIWDSLKKVFSKKAKAKA